MNCQAPALASRLTLPVLNRQRVLATVFAGQSVMAIVLHSVWSSEDLQIGVDGDRRKVVEFFAMHFWKSQSTFADAPGKVN